MEKLLLTFDETAESTGLGRSKLYELVRDGQLEAVKIGKARRITAESLRDFVQRLRETAA